MHRFLQRRSIWQISLRLPQQLCGKPKKVSNWLMVETMRLLKDHDMDVGDHFSPVNLANLIDLVDAGTINTSLPRKYLKNL